MAKIIALTGFPEWLPEQKLIEQRVMDLVRTKFELFGFAPLETRAVEPLDVLVKKGASDKEIYVLKRLHAAEVLIKPFEVDAFVRAIRSHARPSLPFSQ